MEIEKNPEERTDDYASDAEAPAEAPASKTVSSTGVSAMQGSSPESANLNAAGNQETGRVSVSSSQPQTDSASQADATEIKQPTQEMPDTSSKQPIPDGQAGGTAQDLPTEAKDASTPVQEGTLPISKDYAKSDTVSGSIPQDPSNAVKDEEKQVQKETDSRTNEDPNQGAPETPNTNGKKRSDSLEAPGDSTKPESPGESTDTSGDATLTADGKSAMQGDVPVNAEESTASSSKDTSLPNQIQPDEEVKIEELQPNSLFEKNGYYFRTDELGRPVGVYGNLKLQEGSRSDEQTKIGHLGLEGDEGGHLIGTRFNGPTDAFNLVPQNANLNRGAWKTMENDWESLIQKGYDVNVEIEPMYVDDSVRPAFFKVNYFCTNKNSGVSLPTQTNLFINKSYKE